MKKKILIVVILVVIVLLIASIITGIIYLNRDRYSLSYINSNQSLEKDTKFADNVIVFFAGYTGKLYPETIYKSMQDTFNNVIPKLYNDLKGKTDEEVAEYFEKNDKYILQKLGIENKEDFYYLIKKLNSFQGDDILYESSSVYQNSINHLNNRSVMNVNVKYSNNNSINLKLTVKRYTSDERSPIKYTAIDIVDN